MQIGKFYLFLAAAAIAFLIYGIKYVIKCRRNTPDDPTYSQEEDETLEKHLEKYFGPVKSVFHELVSGETHIDIYVVEPTDKFPCYRLFTCGMGAKKMELPPQARGKRPERIELMLSLPVDWQLDETSMENENFYWPIGLLKYLARFPWNESTWLGYGHTIPLQKFAENTELSGVLLNYPEHYPFEAGHVDLPRRTVQFMNVVPLYSEEMDHKLSSGMEGLEELMGEALYAPIDPKRKNFALDK